MDPLPPDLVAPLALLFVFLFIGGIAGLYYYGEKWTLEADARDEGRGE